MCKIIKKLCIIYVTVFNFHLALSATDNTKLELVHVFFRHGDRTTDVSTIYPKDPYINETYYPFGLGELTKKGKHNAYRLGKKLRQRYDKFLGPIYTPDILNAVSSPYNRTISSLELVLAGLFPPSENEVFEDGLLWQPIPFYLTPKQEDILFLAIDNCPNYIKQLNKYRRSPKMLRKFSHYRDIFDYLSDNTGLKINDVLDVLMLNSGLTCEEEWGLQLPNWTKKVYPNITKTLALEAFEFLTGTTDLRKIIAGYFLKELTDNAQSKIDGKMIPDKRKIFLYSGHDFNIGTILSALEIFEGPFPPYTSYILFELHKVNYIYGFKIFYQNYITSKPKLLKLSACKEFCPFDQFVSLVEEYFPQNNDCGI